MSLCNWRINTRISSQLFCRESQLQDVFVKPPKEANTNKLWKLKTTAYSFCQLKDVFIKPPKEANTNKLWKLKTTAYSLCHAPR